MNEVNLIGRLGKDPETNNGACKFSIATNDGTKDKPKTNWHNIVAFGATGETLQKYLKKGDQVGINGRLDYHQHNEKWYTSIIVKSFTFVSGGKSEAQQPTNSTTVESDEEQLLPF